jgi:hypothetical protein
VTPASHAALYREKARELRELAASAPNEKFREQFETLARQYGQLAASFDSMGQLHPVGY